MNTINATRSVEGVPVSVKSGDTRSIRILVPVDFSKGAYDSLEYALHLAKSFSGSIHLFHYTDADELTDSGNPFVINQMLDRMERKATNCLLSLREIIEESGVHVGTVDSMIGNVSQLLEKKTEGLSPDLVVLGKSCLSATAISHLARKLSCPILLIPESTLPVPPRNLAFISCTGNTFTSLSHPVLHALFGDHPTVISVQIASARVRNNLKAETRGKIHFQHHFSIYEFERNISTFISEHAIDMICIQQRPQSFLERIFRQDKMVGFLKKIAIPSLLLHTS